VSLGGCHCLRVRCSQPAGSLRRRTACTLPPVVVLFVWLCPHSPCACASVRGCVDIRVTFFLGCGEACAGGPRRTCRQCAWYAPLVHYCCFAVCWGRPSCVMAAVVTMWCQIAVGCGPQGFVRFVSAAGVTQLQELTPMTTLPAGAALAGVRPRRCGCALSPPCSFPVPVPQLAPSLAAPCTCTRACTFCLSVSVSVSHDVAPCGSVVRLRLVENSRAILADVQVEVAWEASEGYDNASSPSSSMENVCTRCAQRYGAHSGVACPSSATSVDAAVEQVWLTKRAKTSDPRWATGTITEWLGQRFVRVTSSAGAAVVDLKDTSSASNAFAYGAIVGSGVEVRVR
jgi:hypothetical protein